MAAKKKDPRQAELDSQLFAMMMAVGAVEETEEAPAAPAPPQPEPTGAPAGKGGWGSRKK